MQSSSPLAQYVKWEKEIPDHIFFCQPFNGVWKTWAWTQVYLTIFYQSPGFLPCSDEYLEDGIPHIEMILRK